MDTALKLYEPTYAGFICLYWKANSFVTDDCDDGEYSDADDTDLAAWINNVNTLKSMVESGSVNPMDLLDCLGLDLNDIMSTFMG